MGSITGALWMYKVLEGNFIQEDCVSLTNQKLNSLFAVKFRDLNSCVLLLWVLKLKKSIFNVPKVIQKEICKLLFFHFVFASTEEQFFVVEIFSRKIVLEKQMSCQSVSMMSEHALVIKNNKNEFLKFDFKEMQVKKIEEISECDFFCWNEKHKHLIFVQEGNLIWVKDFESGQLDFITLHKILSKEEGEFLPWKIHKLASFGDLTFISTSCVLKIVQFNPQTNRWDIFHDHSIAFSIPSSLDERITKRRNALYSNMYKKIVISEERIMFGFSNWIFLYSFNK